MSSKDKSDDELIVESIETLLEDNKDDTILEIDETVDAIVDWYKMNANEGREYRYAEISCSTIEEVVSRYSKTLELIKEFKANNQTIHDLEKIKENFENGWEEELFTRKCFTKSQIWANTLLN